MSDRIALMNRGRIEQLGAPAELYHQSANEFVADFIGQSNLLSATVKEVLPGRCAIQLDGNATVAVDADGDWSRGDRAPLIIRPENIQPSSRRSTGDNTFDSVVTSVAFIGDSTKYTVKTDSGQSVSV